MKYTKTSYFEYFIDKLFNLNDTLVTNDLSVVKTQKLLFFLTTSVQDENSNFPLLNTFNKFFALPFGHVESDIYTAIKDCNLIYFDINRFGTKRIKDTPITFQDSITELIDKGVENLKAYNLLQRSASYLVDLSHCHDSWINNYRQALKLNKTSQAIPPLDIINEQKFFAL